MIEDGATSAPATWVQRIKRAFATRDRFTGLLWAVIITWGTFPLLYWAIMLDEGWATAAGLGLLAVACAFAVYFG